MAQDSAETELDTHRQMFLAERYRAGSSRESARLESEAARAAAIQLSLEGRSVTLIGSLLVPRDETVFSLFDAASRENVAAVGERTALPYDRISVGVPVDRSTTGHRRTSREQGTRQPTIDHPSQLSRLGDVPRGT